MSIITTASLPDDTIESFARAMLKHNPSGTIRWMRTIREMSQSEFGRDVLREVAFINISRWERGKQSISPAYQFHLLPFLKHDLREHPVREWPRTGTNYDGLLEELSQAEEEQLP